MNLFTSLGIETIQHYAPLHYLPFIGRTKSLKSKPLLEADGFSNRHFRSKSKRSDVGRGFADYAFLTVSKDPRIVLAKLRGGFPHVGINVPVSAFNEIDFDISRYNVAMARRTLRSPTGGFPESNTNGRYYEDKLLPVARSEFDKKSLLITHYEVGAMIEVLVPGELVLPHETYISCYSEEDLAIAETVLSEVGAGWECILSDPPGEYNRREDYSLEIQNFINTAIKDPAWRGNGLEFDRV